MITGPPCKKDQRLLRIRIGGSNSADEAMGKQTNQAALGYVGRLRRCGNIHSYVWLGSNIGSSDKGG